MDIMESVYQRAKARPMRVAFPEGEEEKIIQTARQCADEGICVPVLVGHADAIFAAADGFGIPLDGIEVVDAYDEEWLSALVDEYVPTQTLNSAKTMLRRSKRDCLYAALMMQSVGRVEIFHSLHYTIEKTARSQNNRNNYLPSCGQAGKPAETRIGPEKAGITPPKPRGQRRQ